MAGSGAANCGLSSVARKTQRSGVAKFALPQHNFTVSMRLVGYVPEGNYFGEIGAERRATDFAVLTLFSLHDLYYRLSHLLESKQPNAVPSEEQIEITLAYWDVTSSMQSVAKAFNRSTSTIQRIVRSVEGLLERILVEDEEGNDVLNGWQLFERYYLVTTEYKFELFRYSHRRRGKVKESRSSTLRNRDRGRGRPPKVNELTIVLMMVDQKKRNLSVKALTSAWSVHPATFYAAKRKYFPDKKFLTIEDLKEFFAAPLNDLKALAEEEGISLEEKLTRFVDYLVRTHIPNIYIVRKHSDEIKK